MADEINEIKEVFIGSSVQPISIEKTKIILEQMQKCVCKMHVKGKKGTGFFAKIPYKNNLLDALITNNHVLNDEKFEFGHLITLSLNNGEKTINIKMDDERKRYTNEKLDITIIELKEIDGIKNFLTLDKRIIDLVNSDNTIINEKFNDLYENESIYILNYIKEMFVSYGILNDISGNRINHKCSTDDGSSGSPIILLESNEVIGVHYGHSKYNKDFNFGRLIITSLIEFQNISNNIMIIRDENKKQELNFSRISSKPNNQKFNNINYVSQNIEENQKDSINPNISHIENNERTNNASFVTNGKENSIQFNNLNNFSRIFPENPNQINSLIEETQNYKETQTEITTTNFDSHQEKNKCHILILKYLIKLAYLKKELQSEKNYFQNELTKANIINKNIIIKLMNLYDLKFNELLFDLEKKKLLKGISYHTFNDNLYKIKEYINEILNNNNNKLNELKEEIQISENESSLYIKHSNSPIDFTYLDDFEIIDEKFANFLFKLLKNIRIYPAYFGAIKNKNIFLMINMELKCFYEIMSLNLDNFLIFEALIEMVKYKESYSNNLLKDYIFNYFCKNTIKSLIYKGNPIKFENNNIVVNLFTNKTININTRNNKNNSVKKGNSDNSEDSNLNSLFISKYKNELNKTIKVKFNIIGNLKIEIDIEIDKKINELIFMFFKKINRQELFGDKTIKFYHKNELIPHNSEDLIRNKFYNDNISKIILVNDSLKKLRI